MSGVDWGDLSSQIGFYTYKNHEDIPECPGFYAWFLPLWMYDDDLDGLVTKITDVFSFDSKQGSDDDGFTTAKINFNWSHLDCRIKHVRRRVRGPADELREAWEKAIADDAQRVVIERAMMVASVYMQPLYVGKSDDLSGRYGQHVTESDFKERFESYMKKIGMQVYVRDLVFSCIKTDRSTNVGVRSYDLNEMLEKLIMRLANPPFSKQ